MVKYSVLCLLEKSTSYLLISQLFELVDLFSVIFLRQFMLSVDFCFSLTTNRARFDVTLMGQRPAGHSVTSLSDVILSVFWFFFFATAILQSTGARASAHGVTETAQNAAATFGQASASVARRRCQRRVERGVNSNQDSNRPSVYSHSN